MNVYIDMDSTLNYHKKELVQNWIQPDDLNKDFCKNTRNIDNSLFRSFFLGDVKRQEYLLYKIYSTYNFWMSLSPAENSKEVLKYLKKTYPKVKFIIATSLPWKETLDDSIKNNPRKLKEYYNTVKKAKKDWLNFYYPHVFSKIIFTGFKHRDCKKFSIIIDDYLGAVRAKEFDKLNKDDASICFNKVWIQMGIESVKKGKPDYYVRDWNSLKDNFASIICDDSAMTSKLANELTLNHALKEAHKINYLTYFIRNKTIQFEFSRFVKFTKEVRDKCVANLK